MDSIVEDPMYPNATEVMVSKFAQGHWRLREVQEQLGTSPGWAHPPFTHLSLIDLRAAVVHEIALQGHLQC